MTIPKIIPKAGTTFPNPPTKPARKEGIITNNMPIIYTDIQNGINFDKLPSWQKRGIGVYWEKYMKQGFNPVTGMEEITERRALKADDELPLRDEYSKFIENLLKV